MWRITKRGAMDSGQIRNQIGLFLGTLAIFWSAHLLGKDMSVTAPRRDEREEAPRHVLVISLPDRKLAVMEEGRVLKVYPVAVGAAVSPSPTGMLRIVNKVIGPTYYHKGNMIGPGKSNPLGDRWMGLNQKGYGIHGTNVPSSIGKAASHGCIRMGKHDVEELFSLVRVGDVVEIHGERDALVAGVFGGGTVEISSTARPATPASTRVSNRPATEISPAVLTAMAEETASGE